MIISEKDRIKLAKLFLDSESYNISYCDCGRDSDKFDDVTYKMRCILGIRCCQPCQNYVLVENFCEEDKKCFACLGKLDKKKVYFYKDPKRCDSCPKW